MMITRSKLEKEHYMKEKIYDSDLDLIEDEFYDDGTHRRMVYIPVNKISPHPDNPRKDLGDLTELAESIIESGVLQNLTVVRNVNSSKDYEKLVEGFDRDGVQYSEAYINHATKHAFQDSYTVIIGHRRLAAAKVAGIAEVPCVIDEMDYRTQIATMAAENMQRIDLSVYEQAECFEQMKIDLGMSTAMIAAKTGLSDTTVRRRLKLCELNRETLKKVSGRQISMEAFERLFQIEDSKQRDEALAVIGTSNFAAKCEKALADQEKARTIAERKKICLSLGMTEISRTAMDDQSRYTWIIGIYEEPFQDKLLEKLGNTDPKTLCFHVDRWGYANIRKKKEDSVIAAETEKKQAQTNEKQKREECAVALNEAFDLMYRLRFDFIKRYSDLEAKRHVVDILEMAVEVNREDNRGVDMALFCNLNGFSDTDIDEAKEFPSFDSICKRTGAGVYKLLLTYLYATAGDSPRRRAYITESWHARHGEHEENSHLRAIYDGLCKLGYEMSDYEKALMDGTSDLYYKKEE